MGGHVILAHRQQGQSLVLASLLLMVAAIVLLLMFNTAQLTRSKMELQNTADATAYSVATIAARDYNFSAYMNRAMVANQVAAAQMVSLTSWFRFTGQTIDNVAAICAPIPGLDAICIAMAEAYNTFEQVFEESVFPVIVKVLHYWMNALSDLQMVFHYGNIEAIAQNLFYSGSTVQTGVLTLNDPDVRLLAWPDKSGDIPGELYRLAILIKDAGDWWKFTSRYEQSAPEMSRFAEVTSGSVDDFTNSRSWDLGGKVFDTDWIMDHLPKWLQDAIKFLLPVHISASIDLSLKRRGGTELKQVDDQYSWSAADTLMGEGEAEIDVEVICGIKWCKGWLGIPYPCGFNYCHIPFHQKLDIPFGWGAGYSTAQGDSTPGEKIFHSDLGDAQYGGAAAGAARPTFELAVGEYGETPLASYGGLLPYYDVSKPGDAATHVHDGPQLTIVVSKDLDKVRTAARAGYGAPAKGLGPFGLDNLRLEEPAATDAMYAISKGKLHFALSSQYSNLFSPFWEAKLADTTDQERLLAYETLFGWKELLGVSASPATDTSGLGSYAPQ